MTVQELLNKQQIPFTLKGNDFIVKCLNSEHNDSNPSMRIDNITGIFNCFSCGYKGNIFKKFGEKVNQLQIRKNILINKIIEKRAESIGLSFPPNFIPYTGNWRNIRPETYKKFEAFQHTNPDYIGRIVFPIRDLSGKIVAFQGRHMTNGIPKYKFTPPGAKIPLYPKVSPRNGKVLLVEGIYDMLNLHDKGLYNTVCCFGTNNINEKKLSMLSIQGVEGVDIFFDGDEAGQEASKNIISMCEKIGLTTRNICLEGTDPGALTEPQVITLARKLYA